MVKYNFDPEWALMKIQCFASNWRRQNNLPNKWVVGISGGKDSLVTAAIFAKKFGKENVIGVSIPQGDQPDIDEARDTIDLLGIKRFTVNIGSVCKNIHDQVAENIPEGERPVDADNIIAACTNLPARIRMSTLYFVAQYLGGIVLNTSNLSETLLGYGTLYGDIAGSYAPIHDLTATEVIALGDYMKLPEYLVHKAPADGLSGKTDEDNLGVKYADVDRYIRTGPSMVYKEVVEFIERRYQANRFKSDIINIPGVSFWEYPNYVTGFGGDIDMYEMIKEARNARGNQN